MARLAPIPASLMIARPLEMGDIRPEKGLGMAEPRGRCVSLASRKLREMIADITRDFHESGSLSWASAYRHALRKVFKSDDYTILFGV